jgi:nucleoid-associated protein YgaU
MLNVKAALVICTGFISGLCWLVSQVALPVAAATPRLPELVVLSTPDAESPPEVAGPLTPIGAARSFARQSPFQTQAVANHSAEPRLAVAHLPPPAERPPVALPPLARPAAVEEAVLARAPEPALPESGVAAPMLAAVAASGAGGEDEVLEPAPTPAERAPAIARPRRYTVRKGDSLSKIAAREWSSRDYKLVELLIAANPKLGTRPDRVLEGEELIIPVQTAVESVLRGGDPTRTLVNLSARRTVGEGQLVAASTSPPRETAAMRWYTIRKSDSLISIARRLLDDGRRWPEIAEINGLKRPDRITPGMKLRLPVALVSARG